MSKPAETPAKKARNRTPAVRRDAVLVALISRLPGEGKPFSRALRVNWLRQMAMAMDGAYGPEEPIMIDQVVAAVVAGVAGSTLPPAPAAKAAPLIVTAEPDEIRYYVDADGFARMDPGGKRIRPVDIPEGCELEDERTDDDSLDTVKWADGLWPPGAYPKSITIVKA